MHNTCLFGLTFLAGLMVIQYEYDEDPGNVLIAPKAQVSIAKIYKIEDTVPAIHTGRRCRDRRIMNINGVQGGVTSNTGRRRSGF